MCLVSEIVCSGWIVTAWLDTVATDLTPSLSLLHAILYLPAHLLLNLLETVYLNPHETQQFNFVLWWTYSSWSVSEAIHATLLSPV